MKHRRLLISGCFLLFMLILWSAEFNVADAANLPGTGTINCPLARVRSGPGTDYSIVATLRSSTQITILNQQNGWYQIQAAEIEGWVANSLIDINPTKSLQLLEKLVNLRSGPGISYDKVGETHQGDFLTLLDVSGDWYRIRNSNGLEAYISSSLVEVVDDATPAIATGFVSTAPVKISPSVSTVKGKIKVRLNNSLLTLEVDPIITNGRTLVPLRAIFEALGATVDWDGAKQKVCASRASTLVELIIGSLHPTVNGQDWPLEVPAQIVNGRTLAPLRFVAEAFGSQVTWDENTQTVSINSLINASNPSQPELLPANRICLQSSKDSTGLRIMLVATEKLDPEIKEESGQITIVCKNRQIAGVNLIEEKLAGQSFKALASNLAEDTLINVSLPEDQEYKILTEEGGCKLVVFVPNSITKIDQMPYGSVGERLIVSTLCPVTHLEDLQGDSLNIYLKNVKAGSSANYSCSTNLIKQLQIAGSTENPQDVLISIDTNDLGKYSTAITGDNEDLNIILFNKYAMQNRSRIVVIDPGHGGTEPGTRGKYLVERDVNLAVGLKVGEILKQKGIQIEYTRCDDSKMELELRAALANDLNAALFVSIHHNAATTPTPSGTETFFYAPMDEPELYIQKDERLRLATLIQNELVSRLGRNNRGVKDSVNYSVLGNTSMPSALAEIAFLTNPDEEQLVMQKDFKDLAAQAIANGILAYLGT